MTQTTKGMPMTASDDDITVSRNDAENRYEIHVGDVLAGFTEFALDGRGRYNYPHTVVDPAFQGRGLAGRLVADAMTDAAARGETVRPQCPVVVKYLQRTEVEGLTIDWPSRFAPAPDAS